MDRCLCGKQLSCDVEALLISSLLLFSAMFTEVVTRCDNEFHESSALCDVEGLTMLFLASLGWCHCCFPASSCFLMISLNSMSSGSMKWILRNLQALGFLNCSFMLLPQLIIMIWPGCPLPFFFSVFTRDHIYPSGGFSPNSKLGKSSPRIRHIS